MIYVKILIVNLLLLSGSSFAVAGVNFEELRCKKKGFSNSSLDVENSGDFLTINYEDRTPALKGLVRELLGAEVPDSLLNAYHCINVSLKVPVEDCESSRNLEHFSCNSENIHYSVIARTSCYSSDARDVFTGQASTVSLNTSKQILRRKSFFAFELKLNRHELTGAYRAHRWNYEGNVIEPDCYVDDYVILYREP